MKIFRLAFMLIFIIAISAKADKLLHPYNLNFELGLRGTLPEGWTLPSKFEKMGYQSVLNDLEAIKGTRCMQLALMKDYEPGNYGNVFQMVSAKNYQGRKIIFKVALKTELLDDTTQCRIWVKSNYPDDREGTIAVSDTLSSEGEWKYFQLESLIDKGADNFSFGVTLMGRGVVLIDDVSIEYSNESSNAIIKNTEALTPQALKNLSAFTKIFGYIRYYYPSLELKDFDWDIFALNGSEYIENAKNDQELIEKLNSIFKPLAPAINIINKSAKKPMKIKKPANAIDDISLAWLHIGADLGIEIKFFKSDIRNIFIPTRQREAPAIQILDAMPLRGKKVNFSVWAKSSLYAPDGHGQIWIGIDNIENKLVAMETNANNPIRSTKWEKYSISIEVPENAKVLRLGLVMFGDGSISFDNPEVTIDGDTKNQIKNQGFEDETKSPTTIPSWTFPESAIRAGYQMTLTDIGVYKDKKMLKIMSDEESRVIMVKQDQIFEDEFLPGYFLQMPLTLYADTSGTLPRSTNQLNIPSKPNEFVYNSQDRYSRFALVNLLWNSQKHFAVNIDKTVNWESLLNNSLSESAIISSDKEMLSVLNNLLTRINDGQARAWLNDNELQFGIPILWKFVDNKVIIYKKLSDSINIQVGSEVIAINGKNINDLVNIEKKYITGNTENWKNLRALAQIRSSTDQKQEITIKIVTPSGVAEEHRFNFDVPLTQLTDNRPPQFFKIQEDLYYFDLTKITDRGMKNIVSEMKGDLPKTKMMIFDLRGFTSLSEDFLGMFLEKSVKSVDRLIPVFTEPNKPASPMLKISSEITAKNPKLEASTIFLIDEKTSGLSEIIAGLVKHYKIGVLVGTRTSGNIDEVFGMNLPGNFNASMVSMPVVLKDSQLNFKLGIEPDVEIKPTIDGIMQGRDEILESVYGFLK